jgi:triphosphoribosyl-dephospho-CoA synthase
VKTAVGLCAQLACVWEATARKPGNVHRYQDYDDVTYLDFLASAAAVAPVLDRARAQQLGQMVLECVEATRQVVATNTNLGIILLLAPLAAVPENSEVRTGVKRVLASCDIADSLAISEAIRLAAPGGLGRAATQDVRDEPTLPLREIMALAAERDLVALQYANSFREVFEEGLPALERALREIGSLEGAIIACHLQLMAGHPDSLIARKRDHAEAENACRWARRVLDQLWPNTPTSWETLRAFDAWLRAEGHSRNPGTTADLVAACLFVALREGRITLPSPYRWAIEPPP